MPKSRRERTRAASLEADDIEAAKRELETLRKDFDAQPECELDKLLTDKKTQVRVGQVIGDSVLFGQKKS